MREQSSFTGRGAHAWPGGYQELYFRVTPFPFPSGRGLLEFRHRKMGTVGYNHVEFPLRDGQFTVDFSELTESDRVLFGDRASLKGCFEGRGLRGYSRDVNNATAPEGAGAAPSVGS